MNRARLASAALVVGSVMFTGAVMTAQAPQAPEMHQVLAGKKFTPPVRGEALIEFTQPFLSGRRVRGDDLLKDHAT